MAVITKQQRLEHFSRAFDAFSPYLTRLNDDGKMNLKQNLMVSVGNFSDRVNNLNSALGENKFRDAMEVIGQVAGERLEKEGVQNFSNDLGGLHATNISSLILYSQYQSYTLSYVFDTYGMDQEKTIYNFQQLATKNQNGIFGADDIMYDPRYSTHPMAGMTGADNSQFTQLVTGATLPATIKFDKPIRINSVRLEVEDKQTKEWVVVGVDQPDGYQKGVMGMTRSAADSIEIDYNTGTLTVTNPKAFNNVSNIRATAWYDSTKDATQSNVPTFYSRNDTVTINSMPHQFSLEQNIEDIVHMNKTMAYNKPQGLASSYSKTTIAQLMNLYVKNIDRNIMRTLITPYLPFIAAINDDRAFNLTGWTTGGNANIFEARIDEMFGQIDVLMSGRNEGRTATAILVDSIGAINLMASRKFIKMGAGLSYSDGLIGTYNGIPIIRSRILDYYFSPAWKQDPYLNKANALNISEQLTQNLAVDPGNGEQVSIMFAVHKDPTNRVASGVWGDFIAPYATSGMLANNGTRVVHSILTEYACKLLLPNLAVPFAVKVSSVPDIGAPNIVVK